jgi:galactarate dehydratase
MRGELPLEKQASRISGGNLSFIIEVASGRKTWAEHWKLHNALIPFNPGPIT